MDSKFCSKQSMGLNCTGTISPTRQKALKIFQIFGLQFKRKNQNDLSTCSSEEDLSTESITLSTKQTLLNDSSNLNHMSSSLSSSSCSQLDNIDNMEKIYEISETNNKSEKIFQRKSMSSVGQVLQNITENFQNISSSCTTTPIKENKSKKNKVKPQPQKILRQPINYVYLKGMSGLPTRRVPKSALCCNYLPR